MRPHTTCIKQLLSLQHIFLDQYNENCAFEQQSWPHHPNWQAPHVTWLSSRGWRTTLQNPQANPNSKQTQQLQNPLFCSLRFNLISNMTSSGTLLSTTVRTGVIQVWNCSLSRPRHDRRIRRDYIGGSGSSSTLGDGVSVIRKDDGHAEEGERRVRTQCSLRSSWHSRFRQWWWRKIWGRH